MNIRPPIKTKEKKKLNLIEKFIIYCLRNIKAIKTVIFKIQKHKWLKELSEFEESEITALKRVGKPQREISKALGRSKTFIYNYLKSPNKYGTRKLTGRPEKLSPQFKSRIVHEVKKKTSSTSKIFKYLVDAPSSARTIWRHLNNEKIKHKKRIHHPRLTMKQKEKRLEYIRQYQIMSAKECRKVVFSDEKKFNLDGPDDFRSTGTQKNFLERITQQGIAGEDLLWSVRGASHLLKNLN